MSSRTRVIPILLLSGKGLVKTVNFKNPRYIGDPINTVRIFNEKEVDELAFIDITATPENRGPDFDLLSDIASEAFMPMAYGGGIKSMSDIKTIFSLGFEKIVVSSLLYDNPDVVREAVNTFGSQSIVACIDIKRGFFGGFNLMTHSAKRVRKIDIKKHLIDLEQIGVGEVLVNTIHKDGTFSGYDFELIKYISHQLSVPLIACGGARGVDDFRTAVIEAHASAVAAGSCFVYMGPHKAVLVNYPERQLLNELLP